MGHCAIRPTTGKLNTVAPRSCAAARNTVKPNFYARHINDRLQRDRRSDAIDIRLRKARNDRNSQCRLGRPTSLRASACDNLPVQVASAAGQAARTGDRAGDTVRDLLAGSARRDCRPRPTG